MFSSGVAVLRMTFAVLVAAAVGLAPAPLSAETTGTQTQSADAATTSGAQAGSPDVCVVSGEKLGSMGEPVTMQHNGRTVRFCCKACVDQFKQDPDKYMKQLDQQISAQPAAASASNVCVVSGKELPAGGGKQVVINNQTVRLCCGGCEAALRANPEKYLGGKSGKGEEQGAAAGSSSR